MPFRKKVFYYGLMLFLTLLALEGLAWLAWYAAYGPPGSRGRSDLPANFTLSPTTAQYDDELGPRAIRHPFYSSANSWQDQTGSAALSRPGQDDPAVIALLGGSVAEDVRPFLQAALNRRFAANGQSRPPLIRDLAIYGAKQPQQALMVASALLLGGEFDLIINLDGFNELDSSQHENFDRGVFPFFPNRWNNRVGLTSEELLLVGQIGILRREQARLAAAGETYPLRWSRLFRLANRYRQERTAAQIIQRNHELAAAKAAYSLEKHGPRDWWPERGDTLQAAARVWYRGSIALAQLAELAGADYYHFLQPNQYVPGAKPLSAEELEFAYRLDSSEKAIVEQGYPLLQGFNPALQSRGINYFDLTGIFADHPETLYYDDCCHLNDRGYELLAAAMVERMEPALRRLDSASPAGAVSALAAGRRPVESGFSAETAAFQVSFAAAGKALRYARAGCVPADTEPAFFLQIIPAAVADLPPHRREYGFDQRRYSFAAAGGRYARLQCTAQIPLPDYPIKGLRTGQYVPDKTIPLWSVALIAPAPPGQWGDNAAAWPAVAPAAQDAFDRYIEDNQLGYRRADYAILSGVQPAAGDVFDLYWRDNRLIYLRETCAAADMAADFFLHIVPEDLTDLPEERQDAGFAHGGFAFADRGGPFDGKCLAAVTLPDYAIKEMRTGQYVPGQGELWSVNVTAAP